MPRDGKIGHCLSLYSAGFDPSVAGATLATSAPRHLGLCCIPQRFLRTVLRGFCSFVPADSALGDAGGNRRGITA
jgi:hypothetical protein